MYKNSPFYVVWADIWTITSFMAAAEWNEQMQGGTAQWKLILVQNSYTWKEATAKARIFARDLSHS